MKIVHFIAKLLILFVGLCILLLSVDTFEVEAPIIELILGFLMHALPGLILFLILGLFWKREMILGILSILSAIYFLIQFQLFLNIEDNWMTILTLVVPLIVAGLLLLIKRRTS